MLVGGPCAGKTRTAYEAVVERLSGWDLLYPKSASALARLAAQSIAERTVLWLDDLHITLTDEDGETAAEALRALLDSGRHIVVVATIWTSRHEALSAPPRHDRPDRHTQARSLLSQAHLFPVSDQFTGQALEEFAEASAGEPAWGQAVRSAQRDGNLCQTLAAAVDLMRRYEQSDCAVGRALVTAAADARRLGLHGPLPLAVLQEAAPGYLTQKERLEVTPEWRDVGLEWAQHKVQSVACALPAVLDGSGMGPAPGLCGLDDYLEDHLAERRRFTAPPGTFWEAVRHPAVPGTALAELAMAATTRGRFAIAAGLYQEAIRRGCTTESFEGLCFLYSETERIKTHQGLEELRDALSTISDGGSSQTELGWILAAMHTSQIPVEYGDERAAIAESLLIAAMDAGDAHAVRHLQELYEYQGRHTDAAALERRDPQEPTKLPALVTTLLKAADGDAAALAAVEHIVTARGEALRTLASQAFDVLPRLAHWPTKLAQTGAGHLALAILQAGTEANDLNAAHDLFSYLEDRDQYAAAESARQEWAASSTSGFADLFRHLWPNRSREALCMLSRARREGRGRAVHQAIKPLLTRGIHDRRLATGVLRLLAADGNAGAALELARALAEGRNAADMPEEVETLLQFAAQDLGAARRDLGTLAAARGNVQEAQRWLLQAADTGDYTVITHGLLGPQLFPDDPPRSQAVARDGLMADGTSAKPW
ncbi:hypothetical protein ACFV06_21315 [Streptomyces sp. NPDC059618]|uniref:hypothetical protein n=1 Tax=Streptomyces sp. NPDC059618 TaxID=3346887 RepID=UPI00368D2996